MSQTSIIGSINSKLYSAFPGAVIEVIDNSPEHSSHLIEAKTSTTHVKIRIIAESFRGMSILERHKQIYEVLKSEILHLHAITIEAKDLEQKAN
jgi:BolA family transcriptional regulator, general stress-responsive regulator